MITVACCLWDANGASLPFSRHYTEADVERLYRGFERHLSLPFRFVCFSERPRQYRAPIEQERLSQAEPDYSAFTEPYRLNEPMILVGLDTVVTGDCDRLAAYCLGGSKLLVPRDPFFPQTVCNGVALVPGGHAWVASESPAGMNDMEWIRALYADGRVGMIEDIFGKEAVVSYKGYVKHFGLPDEAAIVYFHGLEKPHELTRLDWIREHWGEAA